MRKMFLIFITFIIWISWFFVSILCFFFCFLHEPTGLKAIEASDPAMIIQLSFKKKNSTKLHYENLYAANVFIQFYCFDETNHKNKRNEVYLFSAICEWRSIRWVCIVCFTETVSVCVCACKVCLNWTDSLVFLPWGCMSKIFPFLLKTPVLSKWL